MNENKTAYDDRTKSFIVSVIEIASKCGSAMSTAELSLLLPQGLELANIREIILDNRIISVFSSGENEFVVKKGYEHLFSQRAHRNSVSKRYLETAKEFADQVIRRSSHVKLMGVCGSVAYRSATMTDDIDIFLVTESHRLWVSFLKTLLLARVFNTKALIKGEKADFCLSYVQDEEHLKEEIEKRRTLLFAREFLSINVLSGITYHNELLKKARWMRQIFPRLYETKLTKQSSETVPRTMNRRPVRKIWVALDLFTYVMLRNYLMFKAFSRNIEYRKKRRMKDTFEAIITKGSCVYNSARYRELESMYPRHL